MSTYGTNRSQGLGGGGGGANQHLSNLIANTAINQDLLPHSDNSINLGSAALNYTELYTYLIANGISSISLDVHSGNLLDENGQVAVGWNNNGTTARKLIDQSNVLSLDWKDRFAKDASNVPSFNYNDRNLHNSSGTTAFNWSVPGALDAKTNNIINIADPVNPQDAATKNYVDTHGGGGSGTVTTVSVVSANGLAGTVATATTTPAITLTTTITGILQGNGTAISAATVGTLTDVGTDGITITGGTGAVLGSGTSIAQHVADATHNGYLSSTDWSTFNGKQGAGNYITALTGDVTASGPGSAAATLATVNANVGSFGDATHVSAVTVDGKGRVTAAASTLIQIAESQVTNLTTDLAAKVTNPMTTAGDMIYGGSSGAPTRLAGDTSNARKFFRETASSGTAQAPAWDFQRVYLNKTASYTLAIGDDSVLFSISSASTATLPTAVGVAGQDYYVRNAGASTAALTINTTSSQTVDGRASASIILSPKDFLHIISDGTNWQALELVESVNAKYTSSTTAAAAATQTTVVFPTKAYDTHSAYNTTTGIYTVPVSGKYTVKSFLLTNAIGWNAADTFRNEVYHSGAIDSGGRMEFQATLASFPASAVATTTINCAAGETLNIEVFSTEACVLSGGATYNFICIEKVGN